MRRLIHMTKVTNLATGQEVTYLASPRYAVELAYRQGTQKDYNTWDYANKPLDSSIIDGKRTVSCGDWCAMKG
jgi:hypothetical protein